MNRDKALTTAAELINGDRARDYGDARTNFQRIADLWSAQFRHKLTEPLTAAEAAIALTHLKLSRLAVTTAHEDSWIDACGYLALGAEIATSGAGGAGEDPDALETGPEAGEGVLRVGARVRVRQGSRGDLPSVFIDERGEILQMGNADDQWIVLLDGRTARTRFFDDELEVIG